jgi:hypothetical protein
MSGFVVSSSKLEDCDSLGLKNGFFPKKKTALSKIGDWCS